MTLQETRSPLREILHMIFCNYVHGHRNAPSVCEYEEKLNEAVSTFSQYEKEQKEELVEAKDQAYWERNQLVLLLSKIYPSHLSRHNKEDNVDKEYEWMVCIHFPTGQGRWHLHRRERESTSHLKWKQKCKWDGHTTEEKYERLKAISQIKGEE